ncbi:endonuclease MutS2 [Candidatus Roseilinea sp. NK_OTU-006]|uniref:endonuclease MutS2 n=1 Tax=Candidatus Roseilinea sp. NK_OTU-006 TaxID=2704250 RepID=UPI00268FFA99|nr:endonuclease MutS2 [Candidatus Roseilinea sp. NK_OTU-006]
MIAKHLHTLELPKILDRLATYCSFSASAALARALEPATDPVEVERRLAETTEARDVLGKNDQLGIGGARDVREAARLAARGGVLEPQALLEIRDTLLSGRNIQRALSRLGEPHPHLTAIVHAIEPNGALIAEIDRCIDDRGEVRDTASPDLAAIRRAVRTAHDRLLAKLQRMVSDLSNAPYLQEALITQRNGRYVIPVKADFKGRIPGIVHDQSASGMTLFIEPLATLELNNEWRELQLAEAREVRRVLTALSGWVGAEADSITRTVEAIARFDLALAKAKYAEATRSVKPQIDNRRGTDGQGDRPHEGESGLSGPRITILQARHPLLNPDAVTPIDVMLPEGVRILVITGPNTGGKTVALKTIGLLALMAQCGLHIPCAQARLPVFEAVYADIGDEQSIEQSLSTFSAHLTNLRGFLERVNERALVLLDELGAGTDPAEGAALARAILEHLLQTGAVCVVATHYPELKAWASLTPGAANANVAFDYETLRPLYQLSIGLPGRSNAFAIAQRLGMPEAIVSAARRYLDANVARAEDMLAEIARLQQQTERALEAARKSQREAEANAERIRARLNAIEDERKAVIAQAREEARRETEQLRAEVRRLHNRIVAAGGPLDEVKRIKQAVEQLAEAAAARAPQPAPREPLRKDAIQAGDTVRIRSLGVTAEVNAVDGEEADVQIGRMHTRVRLNDLERISAGELLHKTQREARDEVVSLPRVPPPPLELDLRGLTTEEGVARVQDYLDRAARAGLPFVRLIHGKGTGVLRRAIRDAIKADPAVQSFETGLEGEGGDGVTVVRLKAM